MMEEEVHKWDRKSKGQLLKSSTQTSLKTFSSYEEAEQYRLEQRLARTDIERFHLMCRLIRIDKMLSKATFS